jgi:hypothetical protein
MNMVDIDKKDKNDEVGENDEVYENDGHCVNVAACEKDKAGKHEND